ncbi:hypothetical protein [Spirosoma areae]
MPPSITVFFELTPINVFTAVAERLGLKNGQQLHSQEELLTVVTENATHFALLARENLRRFN